MRALALAAALTLAAGSLATAAPAPTGLTATNVFRGPALPPVVSLDGGVWMKGDLHIHSRHSKDSSNNPIAKIVALAESAGMDYLCISDHDNHVTGDVAHHTWADPEFHSDKVLLLWCAEWTTHRGHATTISAKPYDHQAFYDVRDARDTVIAAQKKKLGIHFSANHPGTTDAFMFSYDMVDSIEVWNSAIWSRNAISMHIWDGVLKSGRKITGRGGSDSHHGTPDTPEQTTNLSYQAPENNVGTPTTWVYATARTRQAAVDALTNGRVSVSANPYGPRVEFYADRDGDGRMDMMMGDNARPSGKPVTFRVQLTGALVQPAATYSVRVVKDGGTFKTLQISGASPHVDFTDTPAADVRSYYRVEVTGPQTPYPQVPKSAALSGDMVGLSNPIYFNYDPSF
ncbi:CehA/McbA family metallohydrolase [Phenylobacterium sp.]|uniref:CehA/McbA family metallohydrolase n=1 Tax=Phenylobacterium sp. TaxID=1871053 RepID=UPI001210EE54|nr:CehA/McbA family metallohydrolase [Phenylobacterium sp.]THD58988.1 MAG: histidinol-phosphatase [Phenylobacterium sp.]